MRKISSEQIYARAKQDNSWWEPPHKIPDIYSKLIPRPYLEILAPLVERSDVKRTVVLMGPRRVGKTVIIHHLIDRLIKSGINPRNISYFSIDHPVYNNLSLEEFLKLYSKNLKINLSNEACYIFFDEIQYLKDWEIHLKTITDSYPSFKFLASGSAAAALKLKSTESGAGRFTDFLLPPLTFHEYLFLQDLTGLVRIDRTKGKQEFNTYEIEKLNSHFMEYLNFGGYPEVVFSDEIKLDPSRFIKNDIIDKVLLRDLPQLYGIHDIQELNYLFSTLAFNTGGEVSLEELSSNSGVSKNTIKKYLEYFEAAFLIKILHRIDHSAKRFKRANFFKVYLTNPSMRAALFSPITDDDPAVGSLVETAILSQLFHADLTLYYSRWKDGEVDIVHLNNKMKPELAVEAKWSDRYYRQPGDLKSLYNFCHNHNLESALITTKSIDANKTFKGTIYQYRPASLYCYMLGYNIVRGKKRRYSHQ